MNLLEIISKKTEGKELTKKEIEYVIGEYTKGKIKDYQMAALVMAIYLKGMTKRETTHLALAMAYSGEVLDLSSLGKVIVDKHSTGGVGDKVSLILLPLIASLGIPVAKMSGRGLGFTGGTVDKLQSIPGYQTDVPIHSFLENVENIGISMISQTMDLAPADKKIYELRDSISCVQSIPLIASSIMSKKIASGAQKIVLDVTVGNGAFMKDREHAVQLAKEMIAIGKLANRETVCVLTNMEEPLGYAVGNVLEVKEAVHFLQGNMLEDVKQVVFALGNTMMQLAGLGSDEKENKQKMMSQIEKGIAYQKFLQMVENQGGDITYLQDLEKLPKAGIQKEVKTNQQGYIKQIPAQKIGELACFLGAGRIQKEDEIDSTVGIVLTKKVGDKVEKGETIAIIHANDKAKAEQVEKQLNQLVKMSDEKVEPLKIILGVIN